MLRFSLLLLESIYLFCPRLADPEMAALLGFILICFILTFIENGYLGGTSNMSKSIISFDFVSYTLGKIRINT